MGAENLGKLGCRGLMRDLGWDEAGELKRGRR